MVRHKLAPYIISKPLHPTQKTKKNSAGLEIRIKVIPNYELESLILSYGDGIEIMSPENLREKIKERIEQMYLKYNA